MPLRERTRTLIQLVAELSCDLNSHRSRSSDGSGSSPGAPDEPIRPLNIETSNAIGRCLRVGPLGARARVPPRARPARRSVAAHAALGARAPRLLQRLLQPLRRLRRVAEGRARRRRRRSGCAARARLCAARRGARAERLREGDAEH